MFDSQIEILSTGACCGSKEVRNEDIYKLTEVSETGKSAPMRWAKYDTNGEQVGEKRELSPDEIFDRLGVKSRPYIVGGEAHWTLFNSALDDAICRAESYGVSDVRGNIGAVFAASTDNLLMYKFLERITGRPEISPNAHGQFIRKACAGFNSGVNELCAFVKVHPEFEGYAAVGASEILSVSWKRDNFDRLVFGDLASVALFKVTPRKVSQQERGVLAGVNSFVEDLKKNIVIREEDGLLYMNGKEVMRLAPDAMVEDCIETLRKYSLDIHSIDKFVFHPGSAHVISMLISKMKRKYGGGFNPEEHMPCYLENFGNNGAATTANAIHREILARKISRGTRMISCALGMGYHRASFIIQGFPYLA